MMEEKGKYLGKEILKTESICLARMRKMFPWLQIFICGKITVKTL